jgi:general secretion pathway protein G
MHNGETRRCGFSFIELMVVVSITLILICLSVPKLTQTMTRSKESVLKNNLYTLRTVIQHYCFDKGKCPQTVDDLVSEGYLKAVPTDPMNGNSTKWNTVKEEASQSVNQEEPGIIDIHSASDKTSLSGTPYSEW